MSAVSQNAPSAAPSPLSQSLPISPYKGLVPYTEMDARFFFGRVRDTKVISANLISSRLTLLYGPSGVGKTSILRAGVVNLLEQQMQANLAVHDIPDIVVIYFNQWRDNPLSTIVEATRARLSAFLPALSPPTPDLCETLSIWSEQLNSDLLIILDQFEEYFLYHAGVDGPDAFATELPRLVNRADLRVNFLLSFREDALAKLDLFKGRVPSLFKNYLRLAPLRREAARDAILKPVQEYNRRVGDGETIYFEPELVDQVLDEVQIGRVLLGGAGYGGVERRAATDEIEAPFLQLVMTRLWAHELAIGSRVLRVSTLRQLGGASQIVRTHLDAVMQTLSPEEQAMAAYIFRYLVTPSGTKIAYGIADLASYVGVAETELSPVLEKLSSGQVRILRATAPPPDEPQSPRYEIFHDVLAAPILDWRTRYVRAAEQQEAESKLTAEHRRVTRLRLGVIGLSILLLAIVALSIFAFLAQQAAQNASRTAESGELAARALALLDEDPDLSVYLAKQANALKQTEQTEAALRQALVDARTQFILRGHNSWVKRAIFSPDGAQVATGGGDNTGKIWDAHTGELLHTLAWHNKEVSNLQFSPDSRRLLTVSEDNNAGIWDVASGALVAQLIGHTNHVVNGRFSPDNARVVTASYDHTARVWDAATGQPLLTLPHQGEVFSAQFSPDGMRIVTASADDTAAIWDAESGEKIFTLSGAQGHTDNVNNAQWSPDGKWVATVSRDRTARVWNAETGALVSVLQGHRDSANGGLFSPDGKWLLTFSRDRTARIWDWQAQKEIATLIGHTGEVSSAVFRPDGKLVLTASTDRTLKLWEPNSGQEIETMRGHGNLIYNAAFDPSGEHIVSSSADMTARIWNADTGQSIVPLLGHSGGVNSAAFNVSDNQIVTAGYDNARVWDSATGQTVGIFGGAQGHQGKINSAVFSPDGTEVLTTGDKDATAKLWNLASGTVLENFVGHPLGIYNARFSADGKYIVTASKDLSARIWDAASGAQRLKLDQHDSWVRDADFSPDGMYLVTASADKHARVWAVEEALRSGTASARMVADLVGHTQDVMSARFSPDGKYIVTSSRDGTTRVWDWAQSREIAQLKKNDARIMAAVFSPDGNWIATAGEDKIARIWDWRKNASVMELTNLRAEVTGIAYSPDGKHLVVSSSDGTVLVLPEILFTPFERVLEAANAPYRQALDAYAQERLTK